VKKIIEPKSNTSNPKWGATLTAEELLKLLDLLEEKKKAKKDKD
jgi:hypothetical protein